MFKVHTKDGKTTPVDMTTEASKKEWLERFKSKKYQESITGITVVKRCGGRTKCSFCGTAVADNCVRCKKELSESRCTTGVQYSMSRPVNMDGVFYQLEIIEPDGNIRGGEKIICFAGEIALTLMSHSNQPASRVSLVKTGKRRYNPFIE